jgi:hypothetical protein
MPITFWIDICRVSNCRNNRKIIPRCIVTQSSIDYTHMYAKEYHFIYADVRSGIINIIENGRCVFLLIKLVTSDWLNACNGVLKAFGMPESGDLQL